MIDRDAIELRREAKAWSLTVFSNQEIMYLWADCWEDLFNDALLVVLDKFPNNPIIHQKRIILQMMRWEVLRLKNPKSKANRTIPATKLNTSTISNQDF